MSKYLVPAYVFRASYVGGPTKRYNSRAMEDRVLFSLVWQLAMQEHQMLRDVLPVAQAMGKCLHDNLKPDPEQLQQWLAVEERVHRRFGELSEKIAGIQQMVQNPSPNLNP